MAFFPLQHEVMLLLFLPLDLKYKKKKDTWEAANPSKNCWEKRKGKFEVKVVEIGKKTRVRASGE